MKRALGLLFVVSCSGDGIAPTVRFSTLEDGEVTRLVAAALGGDATNAIRMFDTMTSSATGCPSITHDEHVTTLAGGCMTPDGFPVSGIARRVVEPDAIRYDFEGFIVPLAGARAAFDGTVELAEKFPAHPAYRDEFRVRTSDLLVDSQGHAVRSALRFTCERDVGCRTDEPTFQPISNAIELAGRGGAVVAGQVSDFGRADMIVQGFDTLEVFMVTTIRDCMHWRIAGTDRMIAPFPCPR